MAEGPMIRLRLPPLGEGPLLTLRLPPLPPEGGEPPDEGGPETPPSDTPEESISDGLVAAHEPWMTPDLENYLRSMGSMFAEVEEFNTLMEDGSFYDPDLCPVRALPYLAQIVGERLPIGIGEQEARDWIKSAPNQYRGTIPSIVAAAKRRLTGRKLVSVFEKESGDVDVLGIVTYREETPSQSAVEAELRNTVAADLIINYRVLAGQTWANVKAAYPTWQALKDSGKTWAEVATDQPGGVFSGG